MTVLLPDRYIELGSGDRNNEQVARLVQDVTGSSSAVSVDQLKGGITNQLMLAEQDGLKVLVRSFGKGTGTFIDRKREYAVHQCLQTLGLAPVLYCQFGNGLIYGYISGRPTVAEELGDPYMMKQISHRLAQWHATLKPEDVARTMHTDRLGDFWTVLEHWVHICPDGVLPISLDELKAEFKSLKTLISHLGGNQIMGHCDLLSANILVPSTSNRSTHNGSPSHQNSSSDSSHKSSHEGKDTSHLPQVPRGTPDAIFESVASEAAFIDYEYAIPCPRAFDIANHFQEWQGYECKKDRVPEPNESSPQLKFWCQEYLHAYELLTNEKQVLSDLISELQAWWGIPGFYWGIWSAIQSKSSDIDFGYYDYASNRFQEYLDWRAKWRKP